MKCSYSDSDTDTIIQRLLIDTRDEKTMLLYFLDEKIKSSHS